jgi:hypothetical protein
MSKSKRKESSQTKLAKLKREYEALDKSAIADETTIKKALASGKGRKKVEAIMERFQLTTTKMRSLHASILEIEKGFPKTDMRTVERLSFIDNLSRKIATHRLCIEGATAFAGEHCHDDTFEGLTFSFIEIEKLLAPILNGKKLAA